MKVDVYLDSISKGEAAGKDKASFRRRLENPHCHWGCVGRYHCRRLRDAIEVDTKRCCLGPVMGEDRDDILGTCGPERARLRSLAGANQEGE